MTRRTRNYLSHLSAEYARQHPMRPPKTDFSDELLAAVAFIMRQIDPDGRRPIIGASHAGGGLRVAGHRQGVASAMEVNGVTQLYFREKHDPILRELNEKWRRTDQEIADEMGFSRDTITHHRTRLGLPRYTRPKMPDKREAEPPPPKEKPNPLTVAKTWLGKRLEERTSGFWLDGCPASLDTVMRSANAVLKANGILQCGIDRWRV